MAHPASLTLRVLALVLAAALAFAVAPVRAEDAPAASKRYVFVLGTSAMPVAGAALHLAITAQKSGRTVQIMLMADGVELGLDGANGVPFAAYQADGPQMLRQAIETGAEVAVCRICLVNRGIGLSAMAAGISEINVLQLLDAVEAADVVLSFGGEPATPGAMLPVAAAAPATPAAATEPACNPLTDPDACM